MKKTLIYACALLITLGTTANMCDGESDLFDISTDAEFKKTFTFNSGGEEIADVDDTKTINPSDNSGYSQVKDRIKEIEIDKVTYTITNEKANHNSDAQFTIDFAFAEASTSTVFALETVTADFSQVGEEVELQVSQTSLDKLKEFFEAGTEMEIFGEGTLTDGPVNIDVEFIVYTNITASATN